jgi:SAM-dependent methyltransferase
VRRFSHLVPPGASVLDIACGAGRHTRLFAAHGCRVVAVDRDPGLAPGLVGLESVTFVAADLEQGPWPFSGRRFDGLIVTNYLHRPLFPVLRDAVAPGGVVIYETFALGNEAFGRPSNPAFLLRPRELLEAFGADFFVVAYEDGVLETPRRARVQRLCALRGGDDTTARLECVARG